MKKTAIISGLLIIIFTALFLTGQLKFQNVVDEAVRRGNQLYHLGDYDGALKRYKKGLEQYRENPKLNYNSGQAAYLLADYEQAITYYMNAPELLDKYLNQGNSYLKLGDGASDTNQKLQFYQQALESYKQGILKFPENVELKYNYEYVKELIEQMESNSEDQHNEQQNQDQEQNEDQSQEQGDNQDQTQGQDQNQNQGQNQDQSQGQTNDENQGQNQDQSQGQTNDENQEHNQEQQDQQSSQSNQNQDASEDGLKGEQDSSVINEADYSHEAQSDSEIEQALAMLEKQEEDSLKNNQEVNQQGTEEEHGW